MSRVERHQLELSQEELGSGVRIAQELLSGPDVEASDRFVELFVELVTVAISARVTYTEPSVTESEISEYLEHSFAFLNSFAHA